MKKTALRWILNIENEFSIIIFIYSWDLLSWKLLLDSCYRGIVRLEINFREFQFSNSESTLVFFDSDLRRKEKGLVKGLYANNRIDTRHSGFLHLLHRNLCKYVAAIAALSFNPPFIPRPTVQGEAMANKVIVFWQSGGAPAQNFKSNESEI